MRSSDRTDRPPLPRDGERGVALILVLVIAVAGLGYYIYQERQNDGTLSIEVGKDGVKIEKD